MPQPDAEFWAPPRGQWRRAKSLREPSENLSAIARALGEARHDGVDVAGTPLDRRITAPAVRTREPRVDAHRRLPLRQKRAIQRANTDAARDPLKLPRAMRTRTAIARSNRLRYNIAMPLRTMGHYLERLGCTSRNPLKRADEQRRKAIAA